MLKFCRRLRLTEYFADKESEEDDSLVRNKSTFIPNTGRNKCLDDYIENLSNYPLTPIKVNHNLTKGEKSALQNLRNDKSIVIKQADKGGAIVIMDSDYYRIKVEEQLNDSTFYSEIPDNTETLLQSKRQPQNLKRLLTRARFDQQRTFSVSKCRDSRCGACPYIHVGKGMDIPNALRVATLKTPVVRRAKHDARLCV
ncbi:unnamed protein product [Mytilus edulis]|uniref:Uncharacterized protein n=1 Tax=Mytilus edulis TaxID=6550 RepID=A0A8S3TWQ4_MYTED|nr:unnamed protein product [Mytilus edulis]